MLNFKKTAITAVLVASMLASFAACSDGGNAGNTGNTTTAASTTAAPVTTAAPETTAATTAAPETEAVTAAPASAEYAEIFESRGIIDTPATFLMLDSAAYANVDEDGWVDKFEIGYKDDVVHELVATSYIPVSTDEDKKEAEEVYNEVALNEAYEGIVDFDLVKGENYYILKGHVKGLDDTDTLIKLRDVSEGYFYGEGDALISVSDVEKDFSEGYVKR